MGRLLDGMADARATTLVVVAGDHGEAFGEHGEITHSLFTYDTTLRVPLIMSGAGVTGHDVVVKDPVSLVDVAPTIVKIAGIGGVRRRWCGSVADLQRAGARARARSTRSRLRRSSISAGARCARCARGGWKYIAAPHPELYDLRDDPGETQNKISAEPQRAAEMAQRTDAISPADAGRRKRTRGSGSDRAPSGARVYGRASVRAGIPRRPEGSPGSSGTDRGDHFRRAAGRRAGAGAPQRYSRKMRRTRRRTCAWAMC